MLNVLKNEFVAYQTKKERLLEYFVIMFFGCSSFPLLCHKVHPNVAAQESSHVIVNQNYMDQDLRQGSAGWFFGSTWF